MTPKINEDIVVPQIDGHDTLATDDTELLSTHKNSTIFSDYSTVNEALPCKNPANLTIDQSVLDVNDEKD